MIITVQNNGELLKKLIASSFHRKIWFYLSLIADKLVSYNWTRNIYKQNPIMGHEERWN